MSVALYPEDLGNGRMGLTLVDTALRFIDLGTGRVGVDAAGELVGTAGATAGRFVLIDIRDVHPWGNILFLSTATRGIPFLSIA